MPKTTNDTVTLTTTADVSTAAKAPAGVLASIDEAVRALEAAGDHVSAGVLHNLAVRAGELKKHIHDVAERLEGEVAARLKSIRDQL